MQEVKKPFHRRSVCMQWLFAVVEEVGVRVERVIADKQLLNHGFDPPRPVPESSDIGIGNQFVAVYFGAIQNNLNRVAIFGSLCHVRQSGVYSH